MAITSFDGSEKKTLKKHEAKSPYVTTDRVQLLSRVTEKRFFKKKTLDFVSSFPLAANIYKANSDKSLKNAKKKIKKSVLTLPNQAVPSTEICTVSDMNESEYYSQNNIHKPRLKKRTGFKNVCKPCNKKNEFELYDREARYCSEFDVNLDTSSTEIMSTFKGNSQKGSSLVQQKRTKSCRPNKNGDQFKPNDVWAVLRNLNRFPFQQQSPPMSEESIVQLKKNKFPKNRINCKEARVYETKEFARISTYKVNNNSNSLSRSSSFDRVTVIDKQDEFTKLCKQFENRFLKSNTAKVPDLSKNVQMRPKKKVIKKKKIMPFEPSNRKAPLNQNLTPQNEPEYDQIDCSSTDDDMNSSVTQMVTKKSDYCCTSADEKLIHTDYNSCSSKPESTIIDKNKLKGPNTPIYSRVDFRKSCETTFQQEGKRLDIQKRKPRLVTTMPSECMMSKLTQAEIKRKLAVLRFPIVILGKEQVNAVAVQSCGYPQFDGLDKHIWPFMKGWYNKCRPISKEIIVQQNNNVPHYAGQLNKNNTLNRPANTKKGNKFKNVELLNKVSNCKSIPDNPNLSTLKSRNDPKIPVFASDPNQKATKHQKSITHLKEKMINFLFKKMPNPKNVSDEPNNRFLCSTIDNKPVPQVELPIIHNIQTTHAVTKTSQDIKIKSLQQKGDPTSSTLRNTGTLSPLQRNGDSTSLQSSPRLHKSVVQVPQPKTQQKPTNIKRFGSQWGKAKRANDFIESVINKIRAGVYYSPESKNTNLSYKHKHGTDMAMQTESDDNMDISPRVTIVKKHANALPGFESSLPGLEIKTLNTNQIAVKHCVTNIMVQFDVSVPNNQNSIPINTKTLSLAFLELTENHTKIFKCRTTIVNAMLPAELCSILPRLMRQIDSDVKSLRPDICSLLINKSHSSLSPISELSFHTCDSHHSTAIAPKSLRHCMPFAPLSAGLSLYNINGAFSCTQAIYKQKTKIQTKPIFKYNSTVLMELALPKLLLKVYYPSVACQSIHYCMDLEVYTTNKVLAPIFKPYKFESAFMEIWFRALIAKFKSNAHKVSNKKHSVEMNPSDDEKLEDNVSINCLGLPHTHDKSNNLTGPKDSSVKIEYIKNSSRHPSGHNYPQSITEIKTVNNKNHRNGFSKLYRKCKSATSISNVEKRTSMPINKIHNTEDFIQVLGSKGILASVFDGYAENKILSALIEMQNWITDITSKQALLLLLLTNKKDTPNLVRFRLILLQGIALNRITRAIELDMEIEVIEKENFNSLKENEGISYLASVENRDQLLEELYWIAKTTASDYQKPFDESSEKVLKSLMEKRKKLNPSYLRVMARYVGLGLLKQPTKK